MKRYPDEIVDELRDAARIFYQPDAAPIFYQPDADLMRKAAALIEKMDAASRKSARRCSKSRKARVIKPKQSNSKLLYQLLYRLLYRLQECEAEQKSPDPVPPTYVKFDALFKHGYKEWIVTRMNDIEIIETTPYGRNGSRLRCVGTIHRNKLEQAKAYATYFKVIE